MIFYSKIIPKYLILTYCVQDFLAKVLVKLDMEKVLLKQSKTGEILSKKFRTIESYIENPENVINAIFSRENALADEIK